MDSCILQRGNVRLGAFSADQKILYFAAGDKNHGSECAHRNHAFLFNSVIASDSQTSPPCPGFVFSSNGKMSGVSM